ncbi:AsmA-like C-terminal region-containing protein [Lacinutrix sp. 5H-3-7-4]|uniref:AsmA-like C-terminal region-containing protein n=1 Tax=Lacinutrix sp. (strain 5H-3-7-4) TaxID=983544 RepID=UPI00020A3687|nr:AsmA-like C-terminal region-containing protein [Lacinutrix sp. 5H-3-7-4]AEH01273.1 outer membrane protein [Lacinutrix sp. 5H-3-7-4]
MKKILKITGITLLIVIILLILAPFVFQSQIKDMVRNFINQNVNANVEFADVSLSFISSFPQANVTVDELKITNFEPFKDETLASVKSFSFDMSVKELFKSASEGPIIVNGIDINEALVTLKTNKLGDSNWDIAKESKTEATNTNTEGFTLDIQDYTLKNSALTYLDEAGNTQIYITELNHSGKGTFSETLSELDTETEANVTFSLDSTEYLSNNKIKLSALIDLNLEENKYTFKKNTGYINNLPLEFNGFVQNIENGQNIDITFENPGSDFKDFLAVIPETYSKNISNVQTSGNFKIKGLIKGIVSNETIPKLDINIASNNASFKYPDLPKTVKNISINASVKNTTGNVDDTFLDIKTLNFKIDEDEFKSSAIIKNLTSNQNINANIDGVLNLANITQAYPIELENKLQGIVKAKLNTSFDMNAIETNAYERIKNNGNVSVNNFEFSSADIVNPIKISEANVSFNPNVTTLENFKATTGKTDLDAKGTLNNVLGFLLSDKKLKGDFTVNSNTFLISDFMVEGGSDKPINQSTEPDDALKIPAFLDCTINANATTVLYDNLTLKNVKGTLVIQDEKADLRKVTSSIFGGNLALSGIVDTKTEIPNFNMDLGIENFDISQSFKDLDVLKALAPIAKVLDGKLNSAINLKGNLGEDFTPVLNSISGGALAELLTTNVKPENAKLLNALNSKLNFIDFDKLDLKDLKTALQFDDGKVNITPFNLNYKDIGISIGGSHGFDQSMDYNLVFNVPAKYLGSDVNRLIGQINDSEVNNISVPITASLTGNFDSPKVSTDLTSGVKNLTAQLIEIQKQKLVNDGKDKIKDLLGGLGGSQTNKDSTTTETNAPVKDIIKDVILGNNSNSTESTTADTTKSTSNTVKNIIGLFGKKKKQKDTIK